MSELFGIGLDDDSLPVGMDLNLSDIDKVFDDVQEEVV